MTNPTPPPTFSMEGVAQTLLTSGLLRASVPSPVKWAAATPQGCED